MTVVGFDGQHRDQADEGGVVGEDADDVGAAADLAVEALERVGRAQLAPVLGREGVEGGLLEDGADLGQAVGQLADRFAEPAAGAFAGVGVEDRPDQRGQDTVLVFAGVAETVSEEVHGAALPGRPEHLGQRCLEARVSVGDGQLHTDQATGDEVAQELPPERLGLGFADVQADDLAPAGLVHGMRDDNRLARHPAAVADLLDLGVDEQIGVATFQRSLSKRLHLRVEQRTDSADLRLGDAQAQRLDERVDPAGRNPAHIGLGMGAGSPRSSGSMTLWKW